MRAVALNDMWGVDTSGKLTRDICDRLVKATVHDQPIRFVERYVFFGEPRLHDLDADEVGHILASGLILSVVAHVRIPGWEATGDMGEADARHVVSNAEECGYEPHLVDEFGRPPTLTCDLEGVKNSGQPVFDYCKRWGAVVRDAGYSACLYVGYACGLTPAQLYQIPTIDRYWSDYGARSVDKRGFCVKQYGQTMTSAANMFVDPDHAYPDSLGGCITGVAD